MVLYNFKYSFNIFLTYVELTKLCSGRLVAPSPSLEPLAFLNTNLISPQFTKVLNESHHLKIRSQSWNILLAQCGPKGS